MAFGYYEEVFPDLLRQLTIEIKQTFQPFKALQTLGREAEATYDNPLRKVFDLSKHWAQSRTPHEKFFTSTWAKRVYKDLHLLEGKPEFYSFVLSELSFTNKRTSTTKAEKIIALSIFPSDITQMLSQLFFLVTPALFLKCILPALSLLPHFNRQLIV